MPPLTSLMIEITNTQPPGNNKVQEIGPPDGMAGGQNLLNLGADHLVFLCTLQRILCPVGKSCGGTRAFGKRKEKEKENVRKRRNSIIYLFERMFMILLLQLRVRFCFFVVLVVG